jgi:hypothetical protein
MKDFLVNAPNIPNFGIALETGRRCTMTSTILNHIDGKMYNVEMYYVYHNRCGQRLLALVDRYKYSHAGAALLAPTLVFCPACGIRLGKVGKRRLQAWGRLHSFHDIGDLISPKLKKEVVGAYYLFPSGVRLNSHNELIGLDLNVRQEPDGEEADEIAESARAWGRDEERDEGLDMNATVTFTSSNNRRPKRKPKRVVEPPRRVVELAEPEPQMYTDRFDNPCAEEPLYAEAEPE